MLRSKEFREAIALGSNCFRLHRLGNALVQPLRTASSRELIYERVCELMLQHARQFCVHVLHPLHRDAKFSVIDRAAPSRSLRHIEEGLTGIQDYRDAVMRCDAELPDQVVVL